MIVKAYQTAFHRGDGPVKIRPIEIPVERLEQTFPGRDPKEILGSLQALRIDLVARPVGVEMSILDLAFYYGQNDFQPVPACYSVSVGDVLELPGGRSFRVMGSGFKPLGLDENPTALVGRAANTAGYGF